MFNPGVEYHTSEEKRVLYRYGNKPGPQKAPQENEFHMHQIIYLFDTDMELSTFNNRAQTKAITMISNISQQAIELIKPEDPNNETSTEINAIIGRFKKLIEVVDEEVANLVELEQERKY